ncbi:hypothetical protein CT676_23790 [Bradyrhizobium sp. MOS001]|nr:hypothetical protein CT676_23790 [Bradyrhizobium sp. MOS001]
MPGLVPGIHVLGAVRKIVDGRDKPGHDDDLSLQHHFFTSGHAGSGGPNALSPEMVVRIL